MEDQFADYGQSKAGQHSPPAADSQRPDSFADYESWLPEIPQATPESPGHELLPEGLPLGSGSQQAAIDAILLELDSLVGLQRVKQEVRRLVQFVRVQQLRTRKGISTSSPSLHSVFYGSPGTGKTTVARLYGRLLNAMGFLSKGHLVETDRSGLVGNYIGQTANKTNDKISEALGGVLFIDEAYSLYKGEHAEWDYGNESIEILAKRMEDHREDLAVIAAGYPEPMQRFLSSNEGLRSRFATYIRFDDYSPDELLEIFLHIAHSESYEPTPAATESVLAAISYNHSIRDKSFGNARFARNLFETIIRNHAQRIGANQVEPTTHQLQSLEAEDIPFLTPSDTKSFVSSDSSNAQQEDQA